MRDTSINKPHAILLFAAGFGTRMGALTSQTPKPLLKVAGKALIDHAIDLVDEIGPLRIVANLHYKSDILARHLSPKNVVLSYEFPDILETGGGLRAALPLLGSGPVFTLNTDAIWRGPNPLALLLEHWNPAKMDALLVGLNPNNAIGHTGAGDFVIDGDGRAIRGPGLIYGGAQIIKPDGLDQIPDKAFSLNLAWDQMLSAQRLFVVEYPGKWCDVGHPAGIGLAENMIGGNDV
jgi:MurNAc alpha-1-phosphate uridylyltransferase